MRREATALFCLGFFVLAATATGCGRAERSTGSNTNWLRRCETDADCAGGVCWCHACTRACALASECGSASCLETTGLGCGEADAMVCAVACATTSDCADRGPGIECVNGVCLPPTTAGAGGQSAGAGGVSAGAGRGESAAGIGGAPSAGASTSSGGAGTSGTGGPTSGSGGDAKGGEAGQGGAAPTVSVDTTHHRIALAGSNICIASGGKVYCSGLNYWGQLGVVPTGSTTEKAPLEVPGLTEMAGVAITADHSCAVALSGAVYCWGANDDRQVGSDSAPAGTCVAGGEFERPCQPTPTLVPGVDNVVELALDTGVSCALIADGSIRCWGKTTNLDAWLPKVTSATSISLNQYGACATLAGGDLSCSFEFPAEPQDLRNIRRFELAAGEDSESYLTNFGCALGTDDVARCFGDDSLGQLGNGDEATTGPGLSGVVQLAAGDAHACALLENGQLECWGENWSGAVGGYPLASPNCVRPWGYSLGDPAATCETLPRLVEGVPPLVAIAANQQRTCGLAADETLWCWGGGTSSFGAPVRVAGPWEAGGDTCSLLGVGYSAAISSTSACTTDDDCIPVPLDLPCSHTCDIAPVSKHDAQYLQPYLDTLRGDYCSAAADAGCLSPSVTCPERNLRLVCAGGFCAFDDPERTGCTDQCACVIERGWQTIDPVCDGYHLYLMGVVNCGQCEGSWVDFSVANRGKTAFDGPVTLTFSKRDHGAALVPDPVTLGLQLAPGGVSGPIRVDSRAQGYVDVVVSAPGDCYESEPYPYGITWEFPSPSNACN